MKTEPIEKRLEESIKCVDLLFDEKYYEVNSNNIDLIHKAVVKTYHNDKGFCFELAKMIEKSFLEVLSAKEILKKETEPIELSDKNSSIYFSLSKCSKYKYQLGVSGFTEIRGYINEFNTSFIDRESEFFRAILITDKKFIISEFFKDSNPLKVKDSTYGSGILNITVKDIDLQIFGYEDKETKRSYFFIENVFKTNYESFKEIIDDLLLAITFITGKFLGERIYFVGSANNTFNNCRLFGLSKFFEDLKSGIGAIPDYNTKSDYVGVDNYFLKSNDLKKLTEEINSNLKYKRTILLICQSFQLPNYVKASLYSVALESITNLVFAKIESKQNLIKNKEDFKLIKENLKKVLENHSNIINDETRKKFESDIDRLNTPTNKQKLLLPFQYYGAKLPQRDIAAIEHRNDYLHGRIPENSDKHYLGISLGRLLFCVNYLVLKYIGFEGYIYYNASVYQKLNDLEMEENPLRRI
jgi:hypothetical protein